MPSTASTPLIDHPSVFEVLNLFRARWFLNREHLLSLTLSAVKGGDNNDITWIDLLPSSHTHLLRQAKNLAPPSYPLPLLKRVMFTFLLEVINSRDRRLDQFIKSSAPRRRRAPAPAPVTPPPGNSLPASAGGRSVAASAVDRVVQVQSVQRGSTDMPVAPMAVDPSPPPPLRPAPFVYPDGYDPVASTASFGLEAVNAYHAKVGWPPHQPGDSEGPRPQKRDFSTFSPPALLPPTSPPPPVGIPLARAPPDWRAWIAQRRKIRSSTVGGSESVDRGPITPSDLLAPRPP